jgi:hypothetical protein
VSRTLREYHMLINAHVAADSSDATGMKRSDQ